MTDEKLKAGEERQPNAELRAAIIHAAVDKCSPTSDGERFSLYNIIETACKDYASSIQEERDTFKAERDAAAKDGLFIVSGTAKAEYRNKRAETAEQQLAEARAQAFETAEEVARTVRIYTNDDCYAVRSRIVAEIHQRKAQASPVSLAGTVSDRRWPRCKACSAEVGSVDENGLCGSCQIVRDGLRELGGD